MVGNLDEIVGYSPTLVVIGLQAAIDRPVALRSDHKGTSEGVPSRRSVAHHQLALLEDQRGGAEHPGAIRLVLVDRDIRDSACAEMPPVPQAEQPGRRRPGHDGDLAQRIFAAY